ncbi:MAG: hypothetical protein U0441_31650 [Polyangiaceae bacterium]
MSEQQTPNDDEAPPDLAQKPPTAEELAQNRRTSARLKIIFGVFALVVVVFAVWMTTLLVRASNGRRAAGENPDEDNPWQHNPYTAAPSGSAAPTGGPSRGK